MADSNRPWLFQKPEEPPPGLEAIRAWFRKPRPRLVNALGWVRLPLSGLADAWGFVRKNARPAAARMGRIAKAGAKVVEVAARLGQAVRALGVRGSAAARAFRDPEGKKTKAGEQLDEAGAAAQRYGDQITAFAGVTKAALSVLGRLAGMFRADGPSGLRLREEDDSADVPEPPARPDDRSLPPAKRKALPDPEDGPAEPRAEPPGRRPASHRAPSEAPTERPPREAAANPGPTDAPSQPPPRRATSDPGPTDTPAELPTRRPGPAPAAPSPVPEAEPEDRLKGLPDVLRPHVRALGQRPPPEVLRPLIMQICEKREWTTARQLARWFSMHRRSLVHRHLGPMVDAGLLQLRFPDSPRSPRQAYRTRPAE